jgi:hypothetical protein
MTDKEQSRELPSTSEIILEFADGALGKCIKTAIRVTKESKTYFRFYVEPTEKTRVMLGIEDTWENEERFDKYEGCLVMDILEERIITLNPHNFLFVKYWIMQDWKGQHLDPLNSKMIQMEQKIISLSERVVAYSKSVSSANRKMNIQAKFPMKTLDQHMKFFIELMRKGNVLSNEPLEEKGGKK